MTVFGVDGNFLIRSTGVGGVLTIYSGVPIPTSVQEIETDGCSECNRVEAKAWPIYTVNYHGIECCAKCLTPMSVRRRQRV